MGLVERRQPPVCRAAQETLERYGSDDRRVARSFFFYVAEAYNTPGRMSARSNISEAGDAPTLVRYALPRYARNATPAVPKAIRNNDVMGVDWSYDGAMMVNTSPTKPITKKKPESQANTFFDFNVRPFREVCLLGGDILSEQGRAPYTPSYPSTQSYCGGLEKVAAVL